MKTLTPYGVYYYLDKLEKLRVKLGEAAKRFLYSPPKLPELSDIAKLKDFEDFSEIGEWAEKWYEKTKLTGISAEECRKLYFETKDVIERFTEKILDYMLISPNLELLDPEKVRKGAEGFFSSEVVNTLKEAKAITDFNQACKAILVGMPTAAVLYLCKVLRKLGTANKGMERRVLEENFKQAEAERFFLEVVKEVSEGHAHHRSAPGGIITNSEFSRKK